MPITFNADEIFGMAEQIERNGAAFYRRSARSIPSASELLLRLAAMEDQHFAVFSRMHQEVNAREAEPLAADPEAEAALYIKDMADGRIFDLKKDPSETLKKDATFEDVLRKALDIEKDSIVFYLGIKDATGKKEGKAKIEAIIKEEMRHLTDLSKELKKIA
jgi:rubrerythrin